ncbi:MAG TPA: TolC family protein [Ignavibacteriaceae bacterium]|nr:TolC family protein [Ignavibacteriaceae bacterium]
MNKKYFIKIIFLSIFFLTSAYPQKVLTLNESLKIALRQSYGIKSVEYNLISSQKNLEALKLGLRTSIDMEFDLPRYSRTLSSQFNPSTGIEQFFEVGYTTLEGRLLFTQPVAFTNGTFTLAASMWGRDQFSRNNNLPVDYYSNLSLRLRQPLFTFNTQEANLRRAEINLEKSQRNYDRGESEVIYNVTSEFYRLFQSKKQVEIAEEKVKQNEESYNTAMIKYNAGLIAEVEALQLELDLSQSKNQLLNAELSYKEQKDNFKLLIGLNIDESIDVIADIDYKPINVDVEEAIQFALNKRPELLNSNADITLNEMNVDEVDSRGNINAMLSANFGINKNDEKIRDLFHEFSEDRSVVLTLNVPMLDWGKNNREVESAQTNLELSKLNYENQKESIKKEIIYIVNKIESAKSRVEVLSKSVELAEKSYNISLERFRAGTITSFDLSQMQLRLTDARISSLGALIDYNLAVSELSRKTMHEY